jgi:hypothetical protein
MVALSEVSKRGPRLTPEQKAEQKRQRTQARVGLGSNVLGLTAGAAATGAALRDTRFGDEKAGKLANRIYNAGKRIPQPIARLTAKVTPKKAAMLAGGALALQAGNVGGDVVANRVLSRSAQTPVKKAYDESITASFISKADHTSGHGVSLTKAHRRYDPEADRQRRLGLTAGAGAGGALVMGSQAARQFTNKVEGKPVKGILVKPKAGKKALLLTGGTLASGALGAGAYRRGLSERNNPWN